MDNNRIVTESIRKNKYIIVGSGFFGLTVAERIANELHENVTILERREHIGGNAYSYIDENSGIEVHKYGSHIFHTSNEEVWNYVNKFTEFTKYRHKVVANSKGLTFPLPVNLQTISSVFERDLSPEGAREIISDEINRLDQNLSGDLQKKGRGNNSSFESEALKKVGPTIYNRFFRGYTAKQWQTDPSELPREIFTRLPIRFDHNYDYFDDKYQGLPVLGYENWINKMVESEQIDVFTSTNYFDFRAEINQEKILIFTGPIDEFFDYRFGELSWRTVDFQFETLTERDFQGCSVKNYCDEEVPYTRIHEFKHLHPERKSIMENEMTVIAHEYSRFALKNDEPYYPIDTTNNREILMRYREQAKELKNVYFGGRLATYQYLDMHMAIASALSLFNNSLIRMANRNE